VKPYHFLELLIIFCLLAAIWNTATHLSPSRFATPSGATPQHVTP
jgi:hypothetical protein